jgi:hypothetical protein
MKQYEAVIQTIESLWWIATLWEINYNIFKIKDCEWKTKTPFASIRRIVQQTPKEIYKIKPWLYWLEKYRKKHESQNIFPITDKNINSEEVRSFSHYYYQWLLVEIWNLEWFKTYVPPQDQNQLFLNKKLGEIIQVDKMYDFWYENLIRRAKTIDVIYFNERKMPHALYEVEHSTDIQNSLLKFTDLQDFRAGIFIVADKVRRREYDDKLSQLAFSSIRSRVKYLDYDELSNLHTKTFEYHAIQNALDLNISV